MLDAKRLELSVASLGQKFSTDLSFSGIVDPARRPPPVAPTPSRKILSLSAGMGNWPRLST